MKVRLRIMSDGAALYDGVYDIRDAESFGAAFSQAWETLQAERIEKATSIGALYDVINDSVLSLLQGAKITFERAE